jgi:hypothetical protein
MARTFRLDVFSNSYHPCAIGGSLLSRINLDKKERLLVLRFAMAKPFNIAKIRYPVKYESFKNTAR